MSEESLPDGNQDWSFNTVHNNGDMLSAADQHSDNGFFEEIEGDDLFGDGYGLFDEHDGGDDEHEILDPANSERRIYADPYTRLEREIWRPGDGEGDQSTDYFDRVGLPLPLEQRWRLFQTDIGKIDGRNQPPRFVMLDDCAASQVLRSDIQKSVMARNWPHDFAGGGKVRARREHRGRPAIRDPNAKDLAKFHVTKVGGKKEDYYFTGQSDFVPVHYHYEPPKPVNQSARKRIADQPDDYNPRAHGHNQFTPKDLLVKHGAPSFSRKTQHIRAPRINTFLRRDRTPPLPRDHSLYPGIAESAAYSVRLEAEKREREAAMAREEDARREREALREEQERETFQATHGAAPAFGTDGSLGLGLAGSFPIHRLNGFASIPDDFPPVDIPHNMSYAQRTAFEQNSATQILANVQGQDDIIRMALKLARAQVKISEQARQIERLQNRQA